MDIFKIAVIAIAGTVLSGMLKEQKKEYALYVGLATVVVIFGLIINELASVFDFFKVWQSLWRFSNKY